jgi:hypothetical protein
MRSLCEDYLRLYLAECFLKLAYFRQKSVERIKTHFMSNFFPKIMLFVGQCEQQETPQMTKSYGA